jgi:hypothetical protein
VSDPKFIKLSDTAAIRVSNFQDKNGNRFIGLSKMWRRREETGKSSWKPGRQNFTIPEEHFKAVRKAATLKFEAMDEAEVWSPDENKGKGKSAKEDAPKSKPKKGKSEKKSRRNQDQDD